ncbi:MAG: M17 family peptidase N-terminal domain-containing protein, partial [Ktedonobacteraceae bacterium]
MDIQVTTRTVRDVQCDALIIGAARDEEKGLLLPTHTATADRLLDGLISELFTTGEFKGNLGEIATLHTTGHLAARRVIVVGLGPQEKVTTQSIRRTSAIAARHAQNTGVHHLALALHWEASSLDWQQTIQA